MNNKKTIISLVAVIAVAAGVVGIAAMNRTPSTPVVTDTPPATTDTNPSTTTSGQTATPVADKPNTASDEYKDGTYSATGTYKSPGGIDNVGVSATIKNDIVTSVTVTPMPHDPTSAHYQGLFMTGYQALVVGKSVDSVELGAVSGSSLTATGFNDAFAQIKAQAKA